MLTEWRTHLLAYMIHELTVLHVVHEVQENFDRCKHNRRVRVVKLYDDALRHHFRIDVPFWYVS